jgi:eukaryotic-like serine/threonine-protein kinase
MSESVKTGLSEGQCPGCGMELPEQLASMLCPKCLFKAGLSTQFDVEPEAVPVVPRSSKSVMGLPQPSELFGHYKMIRLLGQGGMGVVYEAEDLESGRRVALKILGQALDSPESRKRFLREGQLAASINHPNSVYVFGTEEIAGTPVIAMELMLGGTLQDRLIKSGSLPVAEAVDSVLQIMAGLEAARKVGILHRDIKPSNCFIDSDGTVKIGDFGLSISTLVRTESNATEAAALFGTPAYSSPEQLRGEELSVRSDIYSVGVMLYQLLTGRLPFEAANVVQLLATILERRAESPVKWRPEIPKGLGRLVLRCLEKDAGERFASYDKLREALLPYGSNAPGLATPGVRFLAGCIDVSMPIPFCSFAAQYFESRGWSIISTPTFWAIILGYYSLCEGGLGAGVGKALFGLRTVNRLGNLPGLMQALLRAVIFVGVSMVGIDLVGALVSGHIRNKAIEGLLAISVWFVLLALTFVTARKSNGFLGLHDLGSRTRVIVKSSLVTRPGLPSKDEQVPNTETFVRFGPYHVLGKVGETDGGEILLGYDAVLLRKVWIRKLPLGTPAVDAEVRNRARAGRLRWLNGKRTATEAWDAYEALSGRPLNNLITKQQSWEQVRFWLQDLAEEFRAAQQSDSIPVMKLDRVWITDDGHAKLLDFPAPGLLVATRASDEKPGASPPASYEFLYTVAASALCGRALGMQEAKEAGIGLPIALHARNLLERLRRGMTAKHVVSQLRPLLSKITIVSRARRLALLMGGLWFPIFLPLSLLFIRGEDSTPLADMDLLWFIGLFWRYAIAVVAIPCLISALLFRGGALMRGLGVAVVSRDGKSASRGRVFWRNLLAWLPLMLMPLLAVLPGLPLQMERAIFILLLVVLTLISSILPGRSLQDRLAGTFLVPR